MTRHAKTERQDILVVDDNPDNLDLLTALLKEAGYAVRAAPSPELALQSALAQPPALLLLDIRMPGMDGFELCRRLKQDARSREVPIIFVSGQNDVADRVRGFELGGVDFIGKPFQREEVLARVRTHLALHQAQNELERRIRERTVELEERLRQLRATEEALRASEQMMLTLLDNVDAYIYLKDKEGRYLFANRKVCELWNARMENIVGFGDEKFFDAKTTENIRCIDRKVLDDGMVIRTEDRNTVLVSGQVATYLTTKLPLRLPDGSIYALCGISTDISQLKMAEERMRLDAEQQAILRQMLENTLTGEPLEETLVRCLDQLLTISWLSLLPKGGIFLSDKEGKRLRLTVAHDLSAEIRSLCAELPYGRCLCGRAAASGESQYAAHVDERHEIGYWGMQDHGHYSLPLVTNGQVVGVLVLYLPPGASAEPEKEQFLAAVANILASYIARKAGEMALAENQAHLEQTIQERTADLKASEARTRAIVTTMLDSVVHIDARGTILSVNFAVQDMFGYEEGDMVGRNVSMLMPEPHASAHDGYISRYLQTRRPHVVGTWRETTGRRKDGSLFPIELAVNEMVDDAGSTFIGVMRDMTMQKAAEQEVKKALRAARDAAEAKSHFLANMSHEIRTPLNAVLGLAQIGVRDNHGRGTAETFRRIRDSGSHLLAVVNDILDFSKIEAGKLKIEKRPFALFSVIDNVKSFVAERAEEKGLALSVSVAPDLSDWVEGDSLRLAQILTNLLSNAIKFTERGEVMLRVARDGDEIVFMVADSGIGMNEAHLARLFQSFEQADSSTTRHYGGTGLGLAISRNLANLMGGDIAVDSQPGAGSSFYLHLPLPAVPAPTRSDKREAAAAAAGPRLTGLSILAADDVDINCFILEDLLTHEGARVVFAKDGQQALDQLVEKGVSAFDVVLMDVQMPVMDGLTATRRIAEIAPALPVIGLTAHAMAEERDRCLAAGMVDHVVKPVEIDTLVAAILRQVRLDTQPAAIAPVVADSPQHGAAFGGCDDPDIIDLGVLASRVGSDPAKIAKYTERFVETTRDALGEMRSALAARDLPVLGSLGHRLKSAALTVGAMRFGKLCQELESLKDSNDLDTAQAKVEQLHELFAQIAERAKHVV
jgi:PAS domain S-box-containing protein